MKKPKKHSFTHQDPEKTKTVKVTENGTIIEKPKATDNVPAYVYRDLKRTGIIVTSFIVMVVLLYGIQLKTNWFSPVLKKFGL